MNAISSLSTNNFGTNSLNEEFPGLISFWNLLSQDDRNEYFKLRKSFHNGQQMQGFQKNQIAINKDQRSPNFYKELTVALNYIERDKLCREERSIICGVAFAGPYICVNTRQLKNFLGRCKSSINGSFQQMGYSALRTKEKARNCIKTILRPLKSEPTILRQWTVRGASEKALICFASSFPIKLLPDITKNDLQIEEKSSKVAKCLPNDKKAIKNSVPDHLPFPSSSILNELKKITSSTSSTAPSSLFSLNLSSASAVINSFFANKKMNDSHSVECLTSFDDSDWNLAPKAISDDEFKEFDESHFWEMPLSFQAPQAYDPTPSIADDFLKPSNQW
ncbi:hypothetical protein M9Y10_000940 [Tritrichomonas musculus]|uniref:Initiator binding domain-containing protein n=1 Tax=Tritrichomonas musculus TaxID=1915356 RepID=A0ABR2L5M8_9EUKA